MNKSRFYMFVGVLIVSLILVGSGLAAQNNQNSTGGPTVSSGSTELVAPPMSSHPEAVLWDQPLSAVDQNAWVNQDFTDMPAYSTWLADDFTVDMPWVIEDIYVAGDGWNGFSSLYNATNLTWQIYADNAGEPAGYPGGGDPPVWEFSALPSDARVVITPGTSGYPSNTLLNLDAANYASLPAGDYWLIFYPSLPFSGGGQFGRQGADTVNGGMAMINNPGGGFGIGSGWQDWSVIGAVLNDLAFRLEGEIEVDGPFFGESYKDAPEALPIGDPIPYTIYIINSGTEAALDTSLTDLIPSGTTYNDDVVCSAGTCGYDAATETVYWNGTVDVAEEITVEFSVTPNAGLCGEVVNEATISDPEADTVVVDATTVFAGPVVYITDFEDNDAGFASVGPNPWTWGPPPAGLAPAHSGVNVWATQSPYIDNGVYTLESGALDLTTADPDRPLELSWWQKLDVEVSFDFADVYISADGGSTWELLYEGNKHGSWEEISVDVSAYAGETVMLRFELTTDVSVTYAGWAIDDLEISSGCMPPDIAVDPMSLSEELVTNSTSTQELLICNEGEELLNWEMKEVSPTLKVEKVNIPAFVGPKVNVKGPASFERAPQVNAPTGSQSMPEELQQILGSEAFAVDVYPGYNLVTFDSETPTVWTVIAGLPGSSYFGGDFLDDDFSTLYAVDYAFNQLHTIDTATGAVTVVGPAVPSGGESWTGLSGAPDGTLYGSATTCSTSTLYTVDPNTGTATPIGPVSNAACLIDIAVNSEGEMYGVDIVSNNLIEIDTATGAGTVIGYIGFDANYAQGMDFDAETGNLYLAAFNLTTFVGEFRLADTATGNSTFLGTFPGGAEVDALGFATPFGEPFDALWLSEAPLSGEVIAGECEVVEVTFDSTGLAAGTYEAALEISSNDPDEDPVLVPVELRVGEPNIVVGATLEMTLAPDEVGVLPFTIGNTGDIDLDWTATDSEDWLSVDPTSGVVDEGTTETVDAIFDSTGLAPGVYTGTITITSTDPDDSPSEIAVTLTVTANKFYLPFITK